MQAKPVTIEHSLKTYGKKRRKKVKRGKIFAVLFFCVKLR